MSSESRYVAVTGGKRLCGEVVMEGSKNAALVCMAAACLAEGECVVTLTNIPDISDVRVMIDILQQLGKTVVFQEDVLEISGGLEYAETHKELCQRIRGSQYCLGMMIGALKRAYLGFPGGDRIGARPMDIHLESLEMMGMKYEECDSAIRAEAPDGLKGTHIFLRFPSVGATCNVILAAARASGKTVVSNCAKEPEIVDLANMLNRMGVRVTGAGSDKIVIYGVEKLEKSITYEIIPDRLEAGVFLTAISITEGEAWIRNCVPYHNYPLLSVLKKAGVGLEVGENEIWVQGTESLKPIKVTTMPFPGVATDLQPFLTVLALKAQGKSQVTDLVFPERFAYVRELQKLGAFVENNGNTVCVQGGWPLFGTRLTGSDIRAASALVCAGMIAKGVTQVEGLSHIERGYKDLIVKLNALGAKIEII